MMAGAYCDGCGAYLIDGHDEDQCRGDRQAEINARGRALVRAEMQKAKAQATNTDIEETP